MPNSDKKPATITINGSQLGSNFIVETVATGTENNCGGRYNLLGGDVESSDKEISPCGVAASSSEKLIWSIASHGHDPPPVLNISGHQLSSNFVIQSDVIKKGKANGARLKLVSGSAEINEHCPRGVPTKRTAQKAELFIGFDDCPTPEKYRRASTQSKMEEVVRAHSSAHGTSPDVGSRNSEETVASRGETSDGSSDSKEGSHEK